MTGAITGEVEMIRILFGGSCISESCAGKGPVLLQPCCRDMQDLPDADAAEAKRCELRTESFGIIYAGPGKRYLSEALKEVYIYRAAEWIICSGTGQHVSSAAEALEKTEDLFGSAGI